MNLLAEHCPSFKEITDQWPVFPVIDDSHDTLNIIRRGNVLRFCISRALLSLNRFNFPKLSRTFRQSGERVDPGKIPVEISENTPRTNHREIIMHEKPLVVAIG